MNVKELVKDIKTIFKPYSKRVYIVGGYVRDKFLGIKSTDLDIEVHGISKDSFETIMDSIKAVGVGKSFFVYKYKNIDISLPRVDIKISNGHKGFKVVLAKDEFEAAKRRDFTINALMLNIFSEEILDFFGGIDDIKNKTLKAIDNKNFKQDSLRVLRGIRFCGKYNLKIDKNTLDIMRNININDLSKERVFEEIVKISNSQYLEKSFFYMVKSGVFYQMFNKNITFGEFIKVYKYLKQKKVEFCENYKELYFLYILKELLKIEPSKWLLTKRFKKILDEYSLKQYSLSELLYFATKKPIKDYLFCIENKQKALKFNVFDKKFTTPIKVVDIINDGFKKENIKKELEYRKIKYIDNYLKDYSNG